LILVFDLISSIIYRDTRANLYQLELIVSWESRRDWYGGACKYFLGQEEKGAGKGDPTSPRRRKRRFRSVDSRYWARRRHFVRPIISRIFRAAETFL
jgi:hypothetical protein